jgi:mono/diheme cytochrome c family protein
MVTAKPIRVKQTSRDGRTGRNRPVLIFAPLLALPWLAALLLLVLGVTSSLPVAAQQPPPSPTFDLSQVPAPAEPPAAQLGQASYLENCAPCHGEQGLGDGPTAASLPSPPTVFADPAAIWHRSPAELFHTTKFGRIEALMPPWQNRLTDEQIWQTVAYAWSLHTDPDFVAAGEMLYRESCANCHGAGGAGDGPDAPVDLPNFADLAYAMARSQEDWLAGWQTAHPEMGDTWSAEQQNQVLEYIRTFSYTPAWETGYEPGPGMVTGQVVQGTSGGPAPAPAEVTLEAYADFQPVAFLTTTVGSDGAFEFTELSVEPGLVYLASADHAGIRYTSPLIELSASAPATSTVLTVYETTDEPPAIHIERAHWIVESQPGALLIGQVLTYGSDGDRTFVGQRVEEVDVPVTVALQLPPGATQVAFDNGALGERYRQVGDTIYDTAALAPGAATQQIIVRYLLPYAGDSIEVSQEFLYPVTLINLLVADLPGMTATVNGLEGGDAQDFQGRTYRIWQGADLPANSEVQIALSGLPPAGAADLGVAPDAAALPGVVTTGFAPWMAWLMGGLTVAALAGVLLWSWRAGRVQTGSRGQELVRQREELVRQIAQLDDLHALGALDQASWQQQRAALKARLLETALRSADAESPSAT